MRLLRFASLLSLLLCIAPRSFAQDAAKASSQNSPAPNEEQAVDPDNKRVHVSRFVIAPGQDLSLPVLSNDSLLICLRGESLSQIHVQEPDENWACGPGNTASKRGGSAYRLSNIGAIPAEILVVELKDSYAIDQLRVPWSERDPVNQDPRHFRILFENAHARVLLMHLNSRDGTMESQFADRLDVALTSIHASYSDVEGRTHESRINAGKVIWSHAVMYSAVNLSDEPLEMLMVELKHPFCYELPESSNEVPGAPQSMKAYMAKMREAINKKWMKHMPSGVRAGEDQGLVALQFKIDPDGTIPEDSLIFRMVFANESLMEKALSSVRDASPLPPLPADFKKPFFGGRFTFLYNLTQQPPGCR